MLEKRLDLKLGFTCNNNCIFCAQAHKKHLASRTFEKIKEILKTNSKDFQGVVFTGGEPTIRQDFLELVKYAASLGYSLIQIQSNGRKFSDFSFCKKTIDAGANCFSLSIHGHTPKMHDSLVNSKGSFEQTKQGIKNLIELGQIVATNTVITKQNYNSLPEIAELLTKLYPTQSQFAFVHPTGNALKYYDEVVPKMAEIIPYLKKAVKILEEAGIEPRIEAVPFCLVPEFENYISENYISFVKISDIDVDIEDWDSSRKFLAKSKFPQCRDCKFFLCCEGTWKEYPEKHGAKEFIPILPKLNEVIIELTGNCNLNCDFCFNKKGKKNPEQLSKQAVFKVIEEIKETANAVRFTGGEPFLRKDLKDILQYAKKNKIYTILNTNGALINKNNISALAYVDDILISLHDFSNIKINSDLFKKIKAYKKNITLRACTILTSKNIQNLEKFYSFMEFQPVDEWFLLRQIPNKGNKQPISKKQAKILVEKIIRLNNKYRIKPKIANALPFCVTEKEKTASICAGAKNDSGHTRLCIGTAGNILPDYFSKKILGNIEKDSLSKIWTGVYMKGIRNLDYLPKKCKNCSYNISCKAGLSTWDYADYLL